MDGFSIATWNVRYPGPARLERVADAAAGLGADVLVLTEYARNAAGLRPALRARGFGHWADSTPSGRYVGVAIVSRRPITTTDLIDPLWPWAGVVAVDVGGVRVIGAYAPGSASVVDGARIKQRWWEALHAVLDDVRQRPAVLIGDLNVGIRSLDETGRTFAGSDMFEALPEHGFTDAWRTSERSETREYSWWSNHGNGFRLDHIFVTAGVAVADCRYVHEAAGLPLVRMPGSSVAGVSDHAALKATITVASRDEEVC